MDFDAVMILGKELRRSPERARRELLARAAGASIALRRGAHRVLTLEAVLRGQQHSGSRIVLEMLQGFGVPEERVIRAERTRSTREEAVEAARVCREQRLERLLVLTTAYHVERARWYFDEAFPDGRARVVTPESLVAHARPEERAAIRAGLPDARAWEEERPVERLFAGLAFVLSPLPAPVRWSLEVKAGAIFRRAA